MQIKFPSGKGARPFYKLFKRTLDELSLIVRYETRLVTKGYVQKHAIEFHEPFAPVVRLDVLLHFLYRYVALARYIHRADVSTSSLNGDLIAEGYVEWDGVSCMVNISISKLKQSPHLGYEKQNTLVPFGFTQLETCDGMFLLGHNKLDRIILLEIGNRVNLSAGNEGKTLLENELKSFPSGKALISYVNFLGVTSDQKGPKRFWRKKRITIETWKSWEWKWETKRQQRHSRA